MFWMKIIFIAILYSTETEGSVQCGQPGRPANGTLSPLGRSYFPGEKVTYSCHEGFVIFGQNGRTCLKNGTWSGKVPLCDFNLARGKRTLQSATLWSYIPKLAVDGNKDTCSFTPDGPDPRWWQVHLGHTFNVVTIGVIISPGSFQEFTIFVIELLSNNKALYKPCTEFKGVFQTHKNLFKCNDGLGHPGQYVYIRDDRKEDQYFGLCEVEVFAYRERVPCGEPERPISGTILRTGESKTVYSCDRGHKLEGDSVLLCSSKGEWQGQTPKCKEVVCGAPSMIEKGFIEIKNARGEYVYGTEAKYTCGAGYVLRGPETRVCRIDGSWSEEEPICQAVTCGTPPTFENSKFTYLNATRGHWSGIVIYTCVDGFKLQSDNGDTVSTCLASGSWREINVTCVPLERRVEYIVRETESRSLDYYSSTESPETDSYNRHLVPVLAVTAAALGIGMVMTVAMLLRKRFVFLKKISNSPNNRSSSRDDYLHESKDHPSRSGNDEATQSYCARTSRSSNHFHSNLLQGITNHEYQNTLMYAGQAEGGAEPPYELVTSRLEHSYESLPKAVKNAQNRDDNISSHDTTYDSVSSDKESVGYETVFSPKESKYEILTTKDTGYEAVKNNNDDFYAEVHDGKCTTLEKDPGYETIPGVPLENSYEIVNNDTMNKIHGYETLKPKLPPPRDCDVETEVPDILQDLSVPPEKLDGSSSFEMNQTHPKTEPREKVPADILAMYAKVNKSSKSHLPLKENTNRVEPNADPKMASNNEIPADILALYAKVDKSKKKPKKKYLLPPKISFSPPVPANHPKLENRSKSLVIDHKSSLPVNNTSSFLSEDSDEIQKLGSTSALERFGRNSPISFSSESSLSGSISSSGSSLRPLPPLPR